jgi:predicted nucleic acid-binding protein
MKCYALDTNIISYYLKGNEKIINKISGKGRENCIVIPPMAYYEARRDLIYLNASRKLEAFENLYLNTGIDSINKETLDIAILIYSQTRKIGLVIEDADILIAACCIQNNYILVTNNTKHFEDIENLQVENWMQ